MDTDTEISNPFKKIRIMLGSKTGGRVFLPATKPDGGGQECPRSVLKFLTLALVQNSAENVLAAGLR